MDNNRRYIYLFLFDLVYGAFFIYLAASSSLTVIGGGFVYLLICGAVIVIYLKRYPSLFKPITQLSTFILYLAVFNYVVQYEHLQVFTRWMVLSIGLANIMANYLVLSAISYPFSKTTIPEENAPEQVNNIKVYVLERFTYGVLLVFLLVMGNVIIAFDLDNNYNQQKFLIQCMPFYIIASITYVYLHIRSIPIYWLNLIKKKSTITDVTGLMDLSRDYIWVPLSILLILGLLIEVVRGHYIFYLTNYALLIAVAYLLTNIWKRVYLKEETDVNVSDAPKRLDLENIFKHSVLIAFLATINLIVNAFISRAW